MIASLAAHTCASEEGRGPFSDILYTDQGRTRTDMEPGHMVIATKDVAASEDLYMLIDFLNRNLKDKNVIFGLSKSPSPGKYTVTIYRAE